MRNILEKTGTLHAAWRSAAAVLVMVLAVTIVSLDAWADNVTNSRHNLSRLTAAGTVLWQEGVIPVGDPYGISMAGTVYNQYDEVCVYCHTPHGASTIAPLWNRNVNTSNNYTPYSSSTMDTAPGQPGGVSLACLSCHDGTIAVDSIVNAPGSGLTWTGATAGAHYKMKAGSECGSCHSSVGAGHDGTVKYLGTDLRTTHPVSMTYPTISGVDAMFYPPDGNGKFPNGIKLYGGKVECPSCHNPHLGESDYATTPGLRPFLRVVNSQSAMCVTCHKK